MKRCVPGRATAVALVLLVVLSVAAVAPSVAGQEEQRQVVGEPSLSFTVSENRFTPGERATVQVTVVNAGEVFRAGPAELEAQAMTAQNVELTLRGSRNDAITVRSGPVIFGRIPNGETVTATYEVEVAEDADPGRYSLDVVAEYEYTRLVTYEPLDAAPGFRSVRARPVSRDRTEDVDLVVDDAPRFAVQSADAATVNANDTGPLSVAVRNVGTDPATAVRVRLEATTPGVGFGGLDAPQPTASAFVGRLAPDETRRVSVQMAVDAETIPGEYPVAATVEYETARGIAGTSAPLPVGVTVGPSRSFAIRNVSAPDLRVDEETVVVSGVVENDGTVPARNVVVRLSTEGAVTATGTEAAVGDLPPGASAPVEFTVAVSGDAEPGTREFRFAVEYENADGAVRTARDPLRVPLTVGPEQDAFGVVTAEPALPAGTDGRLNVTIRNTGSAPVSNAIAKLFVDDPLTSPDNEIFLGALAPGEERTAVFSVNVDAGALPKEYPAALEVRYDDSAGKTQFSDDITLGVAVGEPEKGLPVLYLAVGGVLVFVVLVIVGWQRRRGRQREGGGQ